VNWDKQFKKFVAFGKRMPTKIEFRWINNQKSKVKGIRGKVAFECLYGNGSSEWKDRLTSLEIELRNKNNHSICI
jgi:hypothetical protein